MVIFVAVCILLGWLPTIATAQHREGDAPPVAQEPPSDSAAPEASKSADNEGETPDEPGPAESEGEAPEGSEPAAAADDPRTVESGADQVEGEPEVASEDSQVEGGSAHGGQPAPMVPVEVVAEPGTPTSGLDSADTPPQPPVESSESVDVVVYGAEAKSSRASVIRESAQAVQVIETQGDQRRSADLGEVLARVSGVGVRRSGGLGSEARISLNGLTDDQIRYFLEGVPLHLAGYPFGLANVPVVFVDRIEIYRGVAPARFGADALGGAINLVGDESLRGTHATASYQGGSFDTHRLSVEARDSRPDSGFVSKVQGFYDTTRNDYLIHAEAEDANLRPVPVDVHRFHDGYRAAGGSVELGYVYRPWADKLMLRVFLADYDKDLQNSLSMSHPYGEVTYGEITSGASLRYESRFGDTLQLTSLVGYTYSRPTFHDVTRCVYDWYGRCVFEHEEDHGETDRHPRDLVIREDNAFGRAQLAWEPVFDHILRATVAPTFFTRRGRDRELSDLDVRDPLDAEQRLTDIVTAIEYEMNLFYGRLENIATVKNYLQLGRAEDTSPGANFRLLERHTNLWGASDALRYRFHDMVYAKASYEFAARLPRADEIFGDNVAVSSNLELKPERSHNANLSVAVDAPATKVGGVGAEVNGFLRDTERLIQLIGRDRAFSYQNVSSARSIGIEASGAWRHPTDIFSVDGNVTYQDFRNTSSDSLFEGDRIPNRPYLFANGGAQVKVLRAFVATDELTLRWQTRYVHAFFREWESAGIRSEKAVIPAQLSHTLSLSYVVENNRREGSLAALTVEVQNLTDEALFDYYGVQRPGRTVFARATVEL